MAERYTKLYTTESNLYKEGAPVILKAGALLLDTLNAKALAQLKFQSVTPKKIVALSVALQAQNTAGAPLGDAILHTYLDLSVERDTEFGSQTPIYLPDAESRAFSVYVTKVEFADHTLWETDEAGWEALVIPSRPTYELLQSPAAVEEYHRRFGANADLLPETAKDLWRCSCGAINHREEERCHLCASKLEEMRAVTATDLEREHFYLLARSLTERGDDESLKQAIEHFTSLEDYKDSTERKAACEELLAQHQAGRKKAKKIGIIAASITAGILTCLAILFIGILPGVQIDQATALVEAGKDTEAMLYLNNNCGLAKEFRLEQYNTIKDGVFSRATEEAKALVEEGKYAEAYALMTERQCTWGDTYWLVEALNDKDYKKAVKEYGMTHITVPNSVTSISAAMFYGCEALTSITIPNSVTSIDKNAFRGFSSLTSVMFEPGSQLTSIGDSAFSGCEALTAITIPSSVTSIGNSAFYDCALLTSITIPSSVTSIGNSAFANCSSLSSITIPNSVTSIGNSAFANCSSLSSITIPDSVTSIGNYAFDDCTLLTSITIPNSVTSIGEDAFSGCTALTEINFNATAMNDLSTYNNVFREAGQSGNGITVNIGANVTKIPAYLFYPCNSANNLPKIVTVNFAEGSVCESIGKQAFYNCEALTSITIPNSVTSIGEYAFYYCTSLTSVIFEEGSQLTSIGSHAFYNCTSLTSITIPNSVTSIGDWGFHGCEALASITIPNSVTSIGEQAFSGCEALTSITIPNSVTNIGEGAFYACSKLTSITLPFIGGTPNASDHTKHLGFIFGFNSSSSSYHSPNYHLYDRGKYYTYHIPFSLKSVVITNGTSIPSSAFVNCSSLKSVKIPEGTTSIGDSAFSGCSGLTSVEFPASVISIGDSAFRGCTRLTSITIPASVTSIGDSAFRGCTRLTSITIPASVTSIGTYAFAGDYDAPMALKSVTFTEGSQLTSIGERAFNYCRSLMSIEIPASVTSIGENAFYYCTSLTSIEIPASVTSIGECAFYNCTSLTSVTFAQTSGWWCYYSSTDTSGTSISATNLADPTKAARYLRDSYDWYTWYRK